MSACEENPRFGPLYNQIEASIYTVYTSSQGYLQIRENTDYALMRFDYQRNRLEAYNPDHVRISFGNTLHQKLHHYYMQVINTYKVADLSIRETSANRMGLNHEGVDVDNIINMMQIMKTESVNVLNEVDALIATLRYPKPHAAESDVTFDSSVQDHVRDFLVIREFIENGQEIQKYIDLMCEWEKNNPDKPKI